MSGDSGTAMRQSFVDAVLADPDDDAPRLVFADWLEDNGEPERAEFIRLQCALAPLCVDDTPLTVHSRCDPRRDDLEDRQKVLLARQGNRWLQEVPITSTQGRFGREERIWQRGFVTELRLEAATFLSEADRLVQVIPLTAVWLEKTHSRIDDLAACPHLERLRVLDLRCNDIPEGALLNLLGSPFLVNLRELDPGSSGDEVAGRLAADFRFAGLTGLDLGHGRITPEGIAALVGSPHLTGLRRLGLDGNRVGHAGVSALLQGEDGPLFTALDLRRSTFNDRCARILASAPRARTLKDLNVCCNPLRSKGLQALARSEYLNNLESLWVGETSLDPEGLVALSRSTRLRNLKRLWLAADQFGGGGRVTIGAAGVRALASGDGLRLTGLHLHAHALGPEGATTLALWSGLNSLHALDLPDNSIGDAGLVALAASPDLAQLRHLNLRRNQISDRGLIALAESPFIRQLRTLKLGSNPIGPKGAQALAASTGMMHLHELDLGGNPIGDAGAVALAESTTLPALHTLWLGECKIGAAGGQALVQSPGLSELIFLLLFHNQMDPPTKVALVERFGAAVKVR